MHLIDNSTAANTQPTIGPVGPNPNGFFRPKNENLGQLATVIDVDWLNAVQNELASVVIGAGLSLSKTTQNQVLTAINTLIANAIIDAPSTVIKTETQNGHGFTKGKLIYNANGTWALAQGDNLTKSTSVGMVYEVVSTNVFKVLMIGYISGLPAGMNLTANTAYYLSTTVAGGLQTTRPAADGLFIKLVLITDSTTSGFFYNPQPLPYSTGGGGGGDLLAANNLDDLADIPTARDNLGLGTAALEDTDAFISSDDYDDFMQASVLSSLLTKAGNLAGLGDAAQARVNLGLVIGTNVQAQDATLTSIAALGTAADKMLYTTDIDTWAEATVTSFARTLLDDTSAANARTTLGVVVLQDNFVSSNQTMTVNNAYYPISGTVELTLPSTAAQGDKVFVKGTNGCTGWVIKQNSGQTIYHGGQVTLSGTGGQIASSDKHDSIELICTTANSVWENTGRSQGFLDVTTA